MGEASGTVEKELIAHARAVAAKGALELRLEHQHKDVGGILSACNRAMEGGVDCALIRRGLLQVQARLQSGKENMCSICCKQEPVAALLHGDDMHWLLYGVCEATTHESVLPGLP